MRPWAEAIEYGALKPYLAPDSVRTQPPSPASSSVTEPPRPSSSPSLATQTRPPATVIAFGALKPYLAAHSVRTHLPSLASSSVTAPLPLATQRWAPSAAIAVGEWIPDGRPRYRQDGHSRRGQYLDGPPAAPAVSRARTFHSRITHVLSFEP